MEEILEGVILIFEVDMPGGAFVVETRKNADKSTKYPPLHASGVRHFWTSLDKISFLQYPGGVIIEPKEHRTLGGLEGHEKHCVLVQSTGSCLNENSPS